MSALSAIGNFDIKETITVSHSYRWDDGIPLDTIAYYDLLINDPPIASTNTSGKVYIGTAPFMSVTLSSTYTPHPSAVAVKRTYNFGDYYNSESNIIISTCFNDEEICHVYIMPGVYTIEMTIEEYRRVPKIIIPPGQYSQTGTARSYPIDIFWQWKNFSCNQPENPFNRKLTWNYTADCFCCYNWKDAIPCLCQPNCIWELACPVVDNGVCIDPGPVCSQTTWDSLACEETPVPSSDASNYGNIWNQQTCESCSTIEPPDIDVVKTIYTKELIVQVTENTPVAYIEVFQDSNFLNRTSPYKVRLSARNVRAGSFPIERIDWDLGDGTPIKIQRRWAINTDPEFTYNNVYYMDWKDPRNYDIIHEYEVFPGSNLTFYPSLTCYTSSTASFDCAKGLVGPINPTSKDSNEQEYNASTKKPLTLIQNELTDKGKVLLANIDCTAVVWNYDSVDK